MTVQKTGRNNAVQMLDNIIKPVANDGKGFQKVMSKTLHTNVSGSYGKQAGNAKGKMEQIQSGQANSVKKDEVRSNSISPKKASTVSKKNDAVSSKVQSAAENVKNKVKEVLGVSDEDMEKAMTALGMSQSQLFQPQNLLALIQNISGIEDAMDFLTDAQLSQGFKEIMNFVDDMIQMLADDLNITTQDVQDMLAINKGLFVSNEEVQSVLISDKSDSLTVSDKEIEKVAETQNDTAEGNEVNQLAKVLDEKLEVHTESDKKQDGMLQNHNEASEKQVTTDFSQTLAQSVQTSFEQIVQTTTERVNGVDVVRQVVQAVRLNQSDTVQSLEIQLNPAHLGKLNLTVSAKNGIITAELVAQNEQVKKALESQVAALKENFANQGIKVEAVEVTVQSHFFENGQNLQGNNSEQQKNAKGNRRFIGYDELEDLDEDIADDDIVKNENSSVEYTA